MDAVLHEGSLFADNRESCVNRERYRRCKRLTLVPRKSLEISEKARHKGSKRRQSEDLLHFAPGPSSPKGVHFYAMGIIGCSNQRLRQPFLFALK